MKLVVSLLAVFAASTFAVPTEQDYTLEVFNEDYFFTGDRKPKTKLWCADVAGGGFPCDDLPDQLKSMPLNKLVGAKVRGKRGSMQNAIMTKEGKIVTPRMERLDMEALHGKHKSGKLHNLGRNLLTAETRSVLVLQINPTTTTTATQQSWFDAFAAKMAEVSSGQLIFTGQVAQVTVPITTNTCGGTDYRGWADAADAAYPGWIGYFDHVMYVLPAGTGCTWAGLGQISANAPRVRTWYNIIGGTDYSSWTSVLMHEIGHNMGLHHAHANGNEYGDRSCYMGGAQPNSVHKAFNPAHNWQMDFFGNNVEEYNPTSADVGTSKMFVLTSPTRYAVSPSGTFVLKVNDFYLGYNKKVGYLSSLSSEYANKIHISESEGMATLSYLRDTLPVTTYGAAGAAYSQGGIHFQVRYHTYDIVVMNVTVTCEYDSSC